MKKSDFLLLASENAREKARVSESRNVNILGTANSLFHRLVSKGKKKKKEKGATLLLLNVLLYLLAPIYNSKKFCRVMFSRSNKARCRRFTK